MIIVWTNTLYAGQPDALGLNGFGVFNWSAVTGAASSGSPIAFKPSGAARVNTQQSGSPRVQSEVAGSARVRFQADGRPVNA